MSYILDALRRADAERERGEVPSLHSQQYGALPGDEDGSERPLLLIGAVVFLVLALGGALAWNFWGGSDTASRVAAPGRVAVMPAPADAAGLAPSAPAIAALPSPSPAPAPLAPSRNAAPAPTATAPVPAAPVTAEARRRLNAAAASMTAAERRRTARTASAAGSAPQPGGSPGKLPEALRRELPTLAFGGSSYSKDPASRMVIFNGRVFREGDTIAPQLVLQQIKLKSAEFTYKGYRYEMDF
jgi:general secretion pathway protein B